MKKKAKGRQNIFLYRLTQLVCYFVAKFIFKRKILRNEIKKKKGPFVIIGNHEAAYDFVNLIGATRTPMHFVVSESFYNTLPVKGILTRVGVIPKQQFQTTLADLKRMKAVIDAGKVLVIYPAGLMSEDGRSTPIPPATYQFLKWLRTDVYVARTTGTYFAMPKWAKGFRPGRTYLDVYRLFEKEELALLSTETVKQRADEALFFDAYREQEHFKVVYKNGASVEGLENVLYQCPHCKGEFTIKVHRRSTLLCGDCGFEEECDSLCFLHNRKGLGEEIRYVSDWSRLIYDDLKKRIEQGELSSLTAKARFEMIDYRRRRFTPVGEGAVTLTDEAFLIAGELSGEPVHLTIPIDSFVSLPFSPGRYFEIQHGKNIYRCVLKDGKMAMKFIHMVKIFHELHTREAEEHTRERAP